MTDAINSLPRPDVIPNGYLLENPAENFADAIKAAKSQAPAWTQQQKPGTLRSFSRTVGDFTVNVDLDLKGAARVEIDGPTVGRPIAITDFDQASLQAAVAQLPEAWVQARVNAAIVTAAPPKGIDAAVAHAQSRAEGFANWITHIGRKPEAPKPTTADEIKAVRTSTDALRATLETISNTGPENIRGEAAKLRATLGQATFAAETNDGLLGVIQQRVADFDILNKSLTNVITQSQLNAAAATLVPQLQSLNVQIVNIVKTSSGGSLITDLARAAAATGAGATAAIAAAKVKAEAVEHGPIGKLIDLRTPSQGNATPAWIEGLQRSDDAMKNVQAFVGALSVYMQQPMCWGLFSSAEQGPEALQIYATRLAWRDIQDDREIDDKDLAGITREQVTAALEDTNAKISAGLRKFFNQSGAVNDRELVTAILAEAKNPSIPYATLVQAMTEAGIPIPDVSMEAKANAAAAASAQDTAAQVGAAALGNLDKVASENPDIAAFRTFLQGLSTLAGADMRWQVYQEDPTGPQGLYIKANGFAWDPDGGHERPVEGSEAAELDFNKMQDTLEELVERVFKGVAAFFDKDPKSVTQQDLANALANLANASTDKQKDMDDLLQYLKNAGVPV